MMKHFAKRGIARLWMVVLLAWLSMVTVSAVASAVNIGDVYGGGIVFYVDGTGEHGLIANTSASGKTDWFEAVADTNYTKKYGLNGYHDWFVPNIEQLEQLYLNRNVVSDLSYYEIWSSTVTDYHQDYALSLDFRRGETNSQKLHNGWGSSGPRRYVWFVRAF